MNYTLLTTIVLFIALSRSDAQFFFNLTTCPNVSCANSQNYQHGNYICAQRSWVNNTLKFYKCPSDKSCNLGEVLDMNWPLFDSMMWLPDESFDENEEAFCMTQDQQKVMGMDDESIIEDFIAIILDQLDLNSIEICLDKTVDFCTTPYIQKSVGTPAKQCDDWRQCEFQIQKETDIDDIVSQIWQQWAQMQQQNMPGFGGQGQFNGGQNWQPGFGNSQGQQQHGGQGGHQGQGHNGGHGHNIRRFLRKLYNFNDYKDQAQNQFDNSPFSNKNNNNQNSGDANWLQQHINDENFDLDDFFNQIQQSFEDSNNQQENQDFDEDGYYGECECGLDGKKHCQLAMGDPFMCDFMNNVCSKFRGQEIDKDDLKTSLYSAFFYHQFKYAPSCVFNSLQFYDFLKNLDKVH